MVLGNLQPSKKEIVEQAVVGFSEMIARHNPVVVTDANISQNNVTVYDKVRNEVADYYNENDIPWNKSFDAWTLLQDRKAEHPLHREINRLRSIDENYITLDNCHPMKGHGTRLLRTRKIRGKWARKWEKKTRRILRSQEFNTLPW